MDKPTRTAIEQRIEKLEQQRAELFKQMTATGGAIQELKRLLAEPEPAQPEPEAQT